MPRSTPKASSSPTSDQAAVDRGAAPAGARQEEPAWRVGLPPGRRVPRATRRTPPEADEQQRRPEPEQRRREEHVDRERQRRVGVRVDHRGEAGAGRQPEDEAAEGERCEVEVQALPERLSRAVASARIARRAANTSAVAASRAAARPRRRERRRRRRRRAPVRGEPTPPGRARRCDRARGPRRARRRRRRRARGSRASARPSSARGDAPRAPQQREVAAVSLSRAEGSEVGEPERDERAGHREHDVERLGVQRVAGGRGEALGEVVDELHAACERSARRVCGPAPRAAAPGSATSRAPLGRPAPGPATARRPAHPAPPSCRSPAGVIVAQRRRVASARRWRTAGSRSARAAGRAPGPSCGFSGWKSTSAAVTSATPLTR